MQQNPTPNQQNLQNAANFVGETMTDIKKMLDKAYEGIVDETKLLERKLADITTQIAGTFGQTQKAVAGIREEVGVALPAIVSLGGEFADVLNIQKGIAESLNTNIITLGETTSDLFAGARAVGVGSEQVGGMVKNFQDAGFQTGLIKQGMEDTANIARSVGVNTKAVFEGVQDNLSSINKYGFEGGIQGLARMSAQAAGLRINMQEIFGFAERVFNPEGAVEMVSAFQRMGVAAGDLADPFRLMYLASEDTEELQNQVVKMTEKFTYFDEKSKTFKVFPNAKRDLREISTATGIGYEELVKMSVAGQKMQMLTKDFKIAGINEESKQFIANIAQYSEAKKGFTVKIGTEEKLVSELGTEDLKQLKEAQAPKTVEELAAAQLSETKLLRATMEGIRTGLAIVPAAAKAPQDVRELTRGLVMSAREATQSAAGNVRGGIASADKFYQDTGQSLIDVMKGEGGLDKLAQVMKDGGQGVEVGLKNLGNKLENFDYDKVMSKYVGSGNKIYDAAVAAYNGIEGLGKKSIAKFAEDKEKTKKEGVETKTQTDVNMYVDFTPVKVEGSVDINLKNTDGSSVKLTDEQIRQLLDNEKFRAKIQDIIKETKQPVYGGTPSKSGGG